MIVVDTSVLIDYLSGKGTKAVQALDQLESSQMTYFIPTYCVQEVLQGAQNSEQYKKLKSYLLTQKIIYHMDPVAAAIKASKIYFDCRKKGYTIRSSIDCLIAQIAIENRAQLLHSDKDFSKIGKVVTLKEYQV